MGGKKKKDGGGGLTMPSIHARAMLATEDHNDINRGYDGPQPARGCVAPPDIDWDTTIPVLGRGCQTEATLSSQKQ